MITLKAWVSAARLRTLPLSVSGILVGSSYAILQSSFNVVIFWLAIITTLCLQILSNFANDYGDGVKGTDNSNRVGPLRAVQSGSISDKQMKKGIIATSIFALVFIFTLIYFSFDGQKFTYALFFIGLGVLAIYAAINYTVGKSAYGYRGLGDVFVFIFFGLVSVLGSYFLYHQKVDFLIILPAIAIGLLSTAVLNLNNMRDQVGDALAGKITMAVKLGYKKAKIYHISLIIIAFFSFTSYVYNLNNSYQYICLVGFIPLFAHLKILQKNSVPAKLDPELKKVALSTFAIALLHFLICVFS